MTIMRLHEWHLPSGSFPYGPGFPHAQHVINFDCREKLRRAVFVEWQVATTQSVDRHFKLFAADHFVLTQR